MTTERKNHIPLTLMIRESVKGNLRMQQLFYDRFAPVLYKQCLNYTKNTEDAEDLLQEGFIKIFIKLGQYRGDGSFEGWLKTIIFRTAMSHLKLKEKNTHHHHTELCQYIPDREINIFDTLAQKDIVKMVTTLPKGYRNVFIMFAIEGYSHREIAVIMGCSEGTSKSQFCRSKVQLQKKLVKTA